MHPKKKKTPRNTPKKWVWGTVEKIGLVFLLFRFFFLCKTRPVSMEGRLPDLPLKAPQKKAIRSGQSGFFPIPKWIFFSLHRLSKITGLFSGEVRGCAVL